MKIYKGSGTSPSIRHYLHQAFTLALTWQSFVCIEAEARIFDENRSADLPHQHVFRDKGQEKAHPTIRRILTFSAASFAFALDICSGVPCSSITENKQRFYEISGYVAPRRSNKSQTFFLQSIFLFNIGTSVPTIILTSSSFFALPVTKVTGLIFFPAAAMVIVEVLTVAGC